MISSGSLVGFDHFVAKPIFISGYGEGKDGKKRPDEYVGPATFNLADGCIYLYSQHGIFRGSPANDLSTMDHWEKVASP